MAEMLFAGGYVFSASSPFMLLRGSLCVLLCLVVVAIPALPYLATRPISPDNSYHLGALLTAGCALGVSLIDRTVTRRVPVDRAVAS